MIIERILIIIKNCATFSSKMVTCLKHMWATKKWLFDDHLIVTPNLWCIQNTIPGTEFSQIKILFDNYRSFL